MIYTITGKNGGGKTYQAVSDLILPVLCDGRFVLTNIQLYPDLIKKYCLNLGYEIDINNQILVLSEDQIYNFWEYLPQGQFQRNNICIIDECQEFFDSREWNSSNKLFFRFLHQHRKQHCDIYFITPDDDNIDIKIRRLVHTKYFCRDLSQMKFFNINFGYPILLRIIIDGKNPKIIQGREFVFKNPEIFKLYNSFQIVVNFKRLEKKEINFKRISFFSKYKIFNIINYIIIFFIFLIIWEFLKI